MTLRLAIFSLLAGLWPLALAGCSLNLTTHEELVEKALAARPKPTVKVDTFNGAIDVKIDGQALVLAKVRKRGSGATAEAAKADCDKVEVVIEEEPGNAFHIFVRRAPGSTWSGNSGGSVELLVPEEAILDLKTSNGAIDVAGPSRSLSAKSSNGPLSAKGGSGIFDLQTSNGAIEVEATKADLKAQSSNGRLRFVGSLAEGEHFLRTSNGSVNVQMPSDSSFKLDASTLNGRVKCEFDLGKTERERKTHLVGVAGQSPLAKLTIRTSNGTVEIEKRD
jgi:hypothetical protein